MKIICIGRNFSDHAKEMNAEIPTEPVFFLKPDTALISENQFYYPEFSSDIHYECELVVKIKKAGKSIDLEFASNYYDEIGLGIDFTARDHQKLCKEKGLPWEKAKAFDNSAFISKQFIPKTKLDLNSINFSLTINNTVVQQGNSSQMLFNFDQIISYVSKFITLKTGDLIYTGTPEGVGPIKIGDKITGYLESTNMFEFEVK